MLIDGILCILCFICQKRSKTLKQLLYILYIASYLKLKADLAIDFEYNLKDVDSQKLQFNCSNSITNLGIDRKVGKMCGAVLQMAKFAICQAHSRNGNELISFCNVCLAVHLGP